MESTLKLGITILFVIALAIPGYAAVSLNTKPITYATNIGPHPLQGNCTDLTGYENYIVNESTTLCRKTYYMPDVDSKGAIIVNNNNIVLDCNASILIGQWLGLGIVERRFENVTIKNCNLDNYTNGITLESVNYNFIVGNNITNTLAGPIIIENSNNNVIQNNLISYGGFWAGIQIDSSYFNDWSNNNLITNNSICNLRTYYGIFAISNSSNNSFYFNNFINSNKTTQAHDQGFISFWDNGKYGNYWSDYNGSDLNGDGIGDTPYFFHITKQDNFPLMQPNPNAPFCNLTALQPPIANAGPDQISNISETVKLNGSATDSDGFITLYEWDFEGDGKYDWNSTTTGFTTHAYDTYGIYHATLRVTDNDILKSTDDAIICVHRQPFYDPKTGRGTAEADICEGI